jgi:hypothetical protein
VEPDRWQRVAALCGEALEVPATDRTAFLRARCGDDQALRGEVESLLSVASKPGLLDFTITSGEFKPSAVIAGRFRIVRRLDAAEWARSTKPRTCKWAAISP